MRVGITFGEPMYFEGDSSDLQHLRDVTDQIMKRIQQMSGQEYVDMYASEAKLILMKKRREEAKEKKHEEER